MGRFVVLAVGLSGCVQGVTQVAGIGSTYTTRCSATMEARGDEYFAQCTPPTCETTYTSGPVSHVVVAIDPGKKVLGLAERTCIQDLSEASALFQAASEAEAQADGTTSAPAPEAVPTP